MCENITAKSRKKRNFFARILNIIVFYLKEEKMLAKNIREMRREKGLTLEMLAEKLGTSRQTIHRYENGTINNIPSEKVKLLAEALETTPSQLMGWENKNGAVLGYENILPITIKRLPVLGEISCGKPVYAEEEHESYVSADASLDADFCLRASGDSMEGARIFDGDIVFIRSQHTVDNGDIAAVIINDEATLKRVYFYPEEGKLILLPENKKYSPLVYLGEELNNINILGKAVAFQSRVI